MIHSGVMLTYESFKNLKNKQTSICSKDALNLFYLSTFTKLCTKQDFL